jgi:hypothetical protein
MGKRSGTANVPVSEDYIYGAESHISTLDSGGRPSYKAGLPDVVHDDRDQSFLS